MKHTPVPSDNFSKVITFFVSIEPVKDKLGVRLLGHSLFTTPSKQV
jgi:hypothetical protein